MKNKKNAEGHKMKEIISPLCKTKKKHFGEQKQVYIKYGRNECKFICLDNNMVSLVKEKIHFGPLQVPLEDINVEILQN